MSKCTGVIMLDEGVENTERKFGSSTHYYPVWCEDIRGDRTPAMFTLNELTLAVKRAKKNKEDIPDEDTGLFDWLFG